METKPNIQATAAKELAKRTKRQLRRRGGQRTKQRREHNKRDEGNRTDLVRRAAGGHPALQARRVLVHAQAVLAPQRELRLAQKTPANTRKRAVPTRN